jgi:hypothetical protein
MKPAGNRLDSSFKKHVLDSDMIVEVLDVPQARESAARMQMK